MSPLWPWEVITSFRYRERARAAPCSAIEDPRASRYERSDLTEIPNEIGGFRDLMIVFSHVQKRVFCGIAVGAGRRLRQDSSVYPI